MLALLNEAEIGLIESRGDDACFDGKRLSTCPEDDAFDLLDELGETAAHDGDMSFDDFLACRRPPREQGESARSYVEGFNAADAGRIGIAALARQQQAEDEIQGDRSWRAVGGYDLLRSLERIFSLPSKSLDTQLSGWHLHDWQKDPFSRGAYSYAPAGALECSAILSRPAENTLFFEGEHTDTTGHWGTVHGALRSGLRAARQMLQSEPTTPRRT